MDAALQRLVSGDEMTPEDLALFQLILNDGGSESGAALAVHRWVWSRCDCRAAGAQAGWALGTASRWQPSVAT